METRNGVATTTFYAGSTSGIADVRATSGAAGGTTAAGTGANTTSTATNVVTFTIGAAAADTVTIRTNPSSVPASGGTVEVSAVVLDASGQGVAGIPVTFSATRGTLSNIVSTSNAHGVATVGLTTNIETSVSATAGSKSTAAAAVVTVQGAPSITVGCLGSGSTSTPGPSCTQTVGQPITFTIEKAAGSAQIASAFLDFDDGNRTSLGTLSSKVTVTHVYYSQNAYTARVTATDINGETTTASVAVNLTAAVSRVLTVTFTQAAPSSTATATGQRAEFTISVTVAGTTEPVESVTWNFGDGTTATTSGLSTAHVYDATSASATVTRAFTVSATVRTQDGRTGTGRTEIQIKLNSANP